MTATTKEQSARLLSIGILPETADLYLERSNIPEAAEYYIHTIPNKIDKKHWFSVRMNKDIIPAWSLSALIEVLPIGVKRNKTDAAFGIYREFNGMWTITYPGFYFTEATDPIEACVLMIEKLNKKGLQIKQIRR
nr:MAG TPA: hypothetical protein [Caudoviricetes sp.]